MDEVVKKEIIPQELEKPEGKLSRKEENTKKNRHKWTVMTILIVFCIVLITACIFLYFDAFKVGALALEDNYNSSYASEKNETYQKIYDVFFDVAEEKYHVSNMVSISIGDLKETEKLEILKVSDVEYIIEDKKDNSSNIISWLEVPGEGAFVVDLAAGEYIVDDEREYVLVRIPYPELTNVTIDYANVNKLLFENDIFNDSYSAGEDFAEQQLNKADLLIKKEFVSNQHFYLNAQDSARSTIINLVKQLNPKVPNITVEVEFY